jgi:hypothetical protein
MVVGTFKLKLETSFKDERDDGQIRGIWWKMLHEHIGWKWKTHLIKPYALRT